MSKFQIGHRVVVDVPRGRSGAAFNGTEGIVLHRFEESPHPYLLEITHLVWKGKVRCPQRAPLPFWEGEFKLLEQ